MIPIVYGFQAHARDYGSEFFANWNATRWWKISPGVTLLRMFVAPDPGSLDTTVALTPGYSPEQQYMVRSFINLPHRMEWDQTIGYVSRLTSGDIPSYMRLDTRFWAAAGEGRPTKTLWLGGSQNSYYNRDMASSRIFKVTTICRCSGV